MDLSAFIRSGKAVLRTRQITWRLMWSNSTWDTHQSRRPTAFAAVWMSHTCLGPRRQWMKCSRPRTLTLRTRTTEGARMMKNNVRIKVIGKWKSAGCPAWSIRMTRAKCLAVDRGLEKRGKNPTPVFRSHRKSRDKQETNHWVYGSRFPWLRRK